MQDGPEPSRQLFLPQRLTANTLVTWYFLASAPRGLVSVGVEWTNHSNSVGGSGCSLSESRQTRRLFLELLLMPSERAVSSLQDHRPPRVCKMSTVHYCWASSVLLLKPQKTASHIAQRKLRCGRKLWGVRDGQCAACDWTLGFLWHLSDMEKITEILQTVLVMSIS